MKTYEVALFQCDVPKEMGAIPTLRAVVHAKTPVDALQVMVDKAGKQTQKPFFASGAVLGLGILEKISFPVPFGITILLFEPKVWVGPLLKAGVK